MAPQGPPVPPAPARRGRRQGAAARRRWAGEDREVPPSAPAGPALGDTTSRRAGDGAAGRLRGLAPSSAQGVTGPGWSPPSRSLQGARFPRGRCPRLLSGFLFNKQRKSLKKIKAELVTSPSRRRGGPVSPSLWLFRKPTHSGRWREGGGPRLPPAKPGEGAAGGWGRPHTQQEGTAPPPVGPGARLRLPDHLVLLDQGQELRPPGVTQLLTLNAQAHGSRWSGSWTGSWTGGGGHLSRAPGV